MQEQREEVQSKADARGENYKIKQEITRDSDVNTTRCKTREIGYRNSTRNAGNKPQTETEDSRNKLQG